MGIVYLNPGLKSRAVVSGFQIADTFVRRMLTGKLVTQLQLITENCFEEGYESVQKFCISRNVIAGLRR
jgi:hypothetical protein